MPDLHDVHGGLTVGPQDASHALTLNREDLNDPMAGFVDWLDQVNGGEVTGAHAPPPPPPTPPPPLTVESIPTLFGCGVDPRSLVDFGKGDVV